MLYHSDDSRSNVSTSQSNLGSDIRATKDLRGGKHTPSMKEGWLYRTSYDEKNHEIAHMMMTKGDPDPVMMTPRDPDRVMIQI